MQNDNDMRDGETPADWYRRRTQDAKGGGALRARALAKARREAVASGPVAPRARTLILREAKRAARRSTRRGFRKLNKLLARGATRERAAKILKARATS